MRKIFLAFLAGSVLLSQACVMTTTRTVYSEAPVGPQATRQGRVEWIRQTVTETQGNPAAGAAAGAVVGGLLGGLITGRGFGALVGATTGAAVGAQASQVQGQDVTYDVVVRFNNGETRIFRYRGYPPFQPGQGVSLTQRGLVPSGTFAIAQPYRGTSASPSPEPQADSADSTAQPSAPEPGGSPPTPPAMTATPPVSGSPVQQPAAPPGEWAFTQQFGWVWMPYGAQYTFTTDYERGDPYMYVYYPAAGWTWVEAPWLWGWGPIPFFGVSHGVRFGWYGHGWGPRWQGQRPAHYRPWHH
ncbi:MAG: glycine zipper domain-containing protein [Thermoanaerobaculaceae bacterium]|jgi:outer membrane lipoprotein SlyB